MPIWDFFMSKNIFLFYRDTFWRNEHLDLSYQLEEQVISLFFRY